MVSLINNQNKQRNQKSEKTQKTKIWLVIYHDFSLFHENMNVIVWSIRTIWYKGLAEIKEKWRVRKKWLFLIKIAAQVRRLIFQKSFYLVFGG